MIDPADSSLTAIDGAVTFSDPANPPGDAATARFVPRDPADRAAYDVVYQWAFENFPRYVWLDEPEWAAPANGYCRWANTYQVQGAKRMCGHIINATRPRNVMRSSVAMAAHLMAFFLPQPEDRRYLAELVGIPADVFDSQMLALPPHGFLWYHQAARTLTVCPPLRVR